MVAPSGEQIEIAHGGQRAVVVEVGGGLRSYTASERDLLDGYAAGEMCTSGRGQVLVPWPNRVEDGSYEFGGRRHRLPLTEPEANNAIHGLVRWASWRVHEQGPSRVALEHVIHPQPGYPFALAIAIDYVLSERGLSVQTTATNIGGEELPYGSGAHPYLTVGTASIDDVVLHARAHSVVRSDERGLPVDRVAVAGTEYDFRQPRRIGATRLDNAFTDLERDADGLARVALRNPAGSVGVELWVDESYPYLMLFTGDSLADVNRRSLAVEPMTCPPNAFRSGESLIRLQPGSSATSAWGLTPTVVGGG